VACAGFEGNHEMLSRCVGNRTIDPPLIAPDLKYNRGAGLIIPLERGAGTAGSFVVGSSMGCTASWSILGTTPDAVVWGHNYGIVVNKDCKKFYDECKRHFLQTLEMIALEAWRDQNSEAYFVTDSVMMDRFRLG
jgi:tricarballylate dehydrogenase